MTERARGYGGDHRRPVIFAPHRVAQVTGRHGQGEAALRAASQGALLCLLVGGLASAVAARA